MIHVFVGVAVRPERLAEFRALAHDHARHTRNEPGCRRFEVARLGECNYLLVEQFLDALALDDHRRTPHYARWRGRIPSLEARPRTHCEFHAGTLVFTNGCFDVLHAGHARLLEEARAQGALLVVGLNSDASVRALKGPGRPVNPAADRGAVLAALRCVDLVLEFDGEEALADLVRALAPDVLVKGAEYAGRPPAGAEYAGRVVLVEMLAGRSTTLLLAGLRDRA